MTQRTRRFITGESVILFLVVLDQWLKAFFRHSGTTRGGIFFISETPLENTGIAFSIPLPTHIALPLMGVVMIVLGVMLVRAVQRGAMHHTLALSLIVAGGASNMLDRIRWGAIIDIIHLPGGLVINLADSLIVFGILWWVILMRPLHTRS